MRLHHVLLVVFLGVAGSNWLAGQDSSNPNRPTNVGYRVGVNDVIGVVSFQHEEISGEFPVEEDGAVTYPFLGRIGVLGKSTGEIAVTLEELLEKDYYVDVQIQVEVREYRSQPVTVFGEVAKPGTYYLEGPTTLTQLMSRAGGLRPTVGPTIELGRVVVVDGENQQREWTIPTNDILTGGENGEIEVRSGDVISVSQKKQFFITGEISRPGQYEISYGLTLMQAISQAGGLGKFASQVVELHRERDGESKEILEFDIAKIRKGQAEDPSVEAGDVIFAKRRFF